MSRTYCRLCLQETEDFTSLHYTGNKFATPPSIMIKSLVPELYTGVSVNPVICSPCLEELFACYEFRLKCLKTENLIGIYLTEMRSNSPCIRLNDVVGYLKFREKNKETQTKSQENDCIAVGRNEPSTEVIKPNIQSETKNSTEFVPAQVYKNSPKKYERRPMLKPIDIAKLMDPKKVGMFGMEKSPEKNSITNKDDSKRSLLKSSVPTPDAHISFPQGGPIEVSVVSNDDFTTLSSILGDSELVAVESEQVDSTQVKMPDNPSSTQKSNVSPISNLPPWKVNNYYQFKKIAPKRAPTLTPPVSHKPFEMIKTTLQKPGSADIEDEILRNVLEKPGLSNDNDKTSSVDNQNKIPFDYSHLKNLKYKSGRPRPPVVLNSIFESVGDKTMPDLGLRLVATGPGKPKEQTEIRTLNHEISFSYQNEGPASIDLEHEPLATSIIYKPKEPLVASHGNEPCERGLECVAKPPLPIRTVKINPFSSPKSKKGQTNNDLDFSVGQAYTINSEQRTVEDQIDIKEEPLDYFTMADNQLSQKVDEELRSLKSLFPSEFERTTSGESTRSASEASLHDRMQLHDDTDDEFVEDHPEYIEINKTKPSTAPSTPSVSQKINLDAPVKKRTRIRKRLKLVPVEQEELQNLKKKNRTILRKNVTPGRYSEKPRENPSVIDSNPNKNTVVLYTNFSKQGDYVNDHDYLVSPYVRNKIYYRTNNGLWLCCCLLCDLLQAEDDHMTHMEKHSTVCNICNTDFQNVFILNLHVKLHVKKCRKCQQNITYPMYDNHKVTCGGDYIYNKAIRQKNETLKKKIIYHQPKTQEISSSSVTQPAVITSYLPTSEGFMEVLQPIDDQSPYKGNKRSPTPEEEEEEAFIYDKVSKRFVTPSMMKQQKRTRQDSDEDNICLKKLLEDLKLKEQMAKQAKDEIRLREDLIKTYSDLKLGIDNEEEFAQNISLVGLLENQPFVCVTKVDAEEHPGLKINKHQEELDDDVQIVEDLEVETKKKVDIITNIEQNEAKNESDIIEMKAITKISTALTNLEKGREFVRNKRRKRQMAALKSAASRLSRKKQIVEEEEKKTDNTETATTDDTQKNRTIGNDDMKKSDENVEENHQSAEKTDLDLTESEANVVSTFGGTNTSQIEEMLNDGQPLNEGLEAKDKSVSAEIMEESTQDSTEMVENPFSSRRSVRLRNRNEFTSGVLATLGWSTRRRSKVSLLTDKTAQTTEEADGKGEESEPDQIKDLQVDKNDKKVDHSVESDQISNKNAQTFYENDEIEYPEESIQDIQTPEDKKKKLKKTPSTKELETLELEMLRLRTEISKLKEMKPKKKKRKIKKIPKELIDKLRKTEEASDNDTTLSQLCDTVLTTLTDDSSQDISVGDENSQSTIFITEIENEDVNISKNTDVRVFDQNPSTETIKKTEDDPDTSETRITNTSFEKLAGETMEEFYQRLEHSACESANHPRMRKRPRRLEESITTIKRARTTRTKLAQSEVHKDGLEVSKDSNEESVTITKKARTSRATLKGSSVDNLSEVAQQEAAQSINEAGHVIKKVKKIPKEMIGYTRGKRRYGFHWIKRKASRLRKIKKEVIEDETNVPSSEMDPYNFDSELEGIEGTPTDLIRHKEIKNVTESPQVSEHLDKTLIEDRLALESLEGDNSRDTPIRKKDPIKDDSKKQKKNRRAKKNPLYVKKQLTTEETLPEEHQPMEDLESILQKIIMQAPGSKPKNHRDRSKVLKKNPLNVRNRAKRVIKKPKKLLEKLEDQNSSESRQIKFEELENIDKDSELVKECSSLQINQLSISDDVTDSPSVEKGSDLQEPDSVPPKQEIFDKRTRKSSRKHVRDTRESSQPARKSKKRVKTLKELKEELQNLKRNSSLLDKPQIDSYKELSKDAESDEVKNSSINEKTHFAALESVEFPPELQTTSADPVEGCEMSKTTMKSRKVEDQQAYRSSKRRIKKTTKTRRTLVTSNISESSCEEIDGSSIESKEDRMRPQKNDSGSQIDGCSVESKEDTNKELRRPQKNDSGSEIDGRSVESKEDTIKEITENDSGTTGDSSCLCVMCATSIEIISKPQKKKYTTHNTHLRRKSSLKRRSLIAAEKTSSVNHGSVSNVVEDDRSSCQKPSDVIDSEQKRIEGPRASRNAAEYDEGDHRISGGQPSEDQLLEQTPEGAA